MYTFAHTWCLFSKKLDTIKMFISGRLAVVPFIQWNVCTCKGRGLKCADEKIFKIYEWMKVQHCVSVCLKSLYTLLFFICSDRLSNDVRENRKRHLQESQKGGWDVGWEEGRLHTLCCFIPFRFCTMFQILPLKKLTALKRVTEISRKTKIKTKKTPEKPKKNPQNPTTT